MTNDRLSSLAILLTLLFVVNFLTSISSAGPKQAGDDTPTVGQPGDSDHWSGGQYGEYDTFPIQPDDDGGSQSQYDGGKSGSACFDELGGGSDGRNNSDLF